MFPHARIEHIGSTAVPGLPGKDVVDVMLGVDRQLVDDTVVALSTGGFDVEGQRAGHGWLSWPHRCARQVVVHVVALDGSQWNDRLAFRDLLRTDPGARARYLAVKRAAAADSTGWGDYTAFKAPVVTELLSLARQPARSDHDR